MPITNLTNRAPPLEPMPEVYKDLHLLDSNDNKQTNFKMPEQSVKKELPKTDIYKRMKKLSSFKQIKRTYKLENQKQQFLNDLQELFQHIKIEEHQYDVELLIELLNATEQYFIYGSKKERERSKLDVIEDVMLPFFGNNQEVLFRFINTVSSKVTKSNLFRRLFRRAYNFFL